MNRFITNEKSIFPAYSTLLIWKKPEMDIDVTGTWNFNWKFSIILGFGSNLKAIFFLLKWRKKFSISFGWSLRSTHIVLYNKLFVKNLKTESPKNAALVFISENRYHFLLSCLGLSNPQARRIITICSNDEHILMKIQRNLNSKFIFIFVKYE